MRRTARPTSCTWAFLFFFFLHQRCICIWHVIRSPLFSWKQLRLTACLITIMMWGFWPKNYFLIYFHIKHTHYTHTLRASRNQFTNSKNNRIVQKYKIKLEIKNFYLIPDLPFQARQRFKTTIIKPTSSNRTCWYQEREVYIIFEKRLKKQLFFLLFSSDFSFLFQI